ncbi:hypothetical protein M758_7G143000 [Ceratodon purpureus]|nr:hypothetical protein M758_7G143000 [Ceratodon purpureus]
MTLLHLVFAIAGLNPRHSSAQSTQVSQRCDEVWNDELRWTGEFADVDWTII